MTKETDLSAAGRELARQGAKKGGRARANVLSPDERSHIARNAVLARWARAGKPAPAALEGETVGWAIPASKRVGPTMPYSMFHGELKLGDVTMECHVLNDGRRVLTQREVVRVLSGGRVSGTLSRYLQRLQSYNPGQFDGRTFGFNVSSQTVATGYEATVLIEICELYLNARAEGSLKPSQLKLAAMAEVIVRSTAKVGIIALIDEVTGFQEVRAKNDLQRKLEAFIAEELGEWAKLFPDEFWYELARLEGIHYSPRSRPLRWGKYVMSFVYDAVDKDVGKVLRERNPNPHYTQNHHQWLKEFGRGKVHDHLERVIAVMKTCDDMGQFRRRFAHVFLKTPLQLGFDDVYRPN